MDRKTLEVFLVGTGLIAAGTVVDIAQHFEERQILRNGLLLSEGSICDDYLFLEEGCMRAFAHDTDGNEVTTGFYMPGQVVFEVSSFFNRTRSKENIQAVTDCKGWSITYEQLNTLFHASPEFREFGRHILVTGFSGLKTRMLSMITETAEERYTQLWETNPDILKTAPLKYIASYLGITDTSLSRIRAALSRKH